VKCAECRGACCQSFSLPAIHILAPTADARRWVELHAATVHQTLRHGQILEFETPCTKLTGEGSCGIYDTRPQVCREYRPGGVECLATVKARRSPEQYAAIRDEGDPLTIHEGAA
jgi:Fe-S-cluster containining protein